jgi:hypothetical protein
MLIWLAAKGATVKGTAARSGVFARRIGTQHYKISESRNELQVRLPITSWSPVRITLRVGGSKDLLPVSGDERHRPTRHRVVRIGETGGLGTPLISSYAVLAR